MTSAQSKAYRFRHVLLILGLLFTITGLTWTLLPLFEDLEIFGIDPAGLLGTPLIIPGVDAFKMTGGYLINFVLIAGIFLLLQWAFLRPAKGWKAKLTQEGRPLRSSVISAGLMSTLLTIGAISLIMELPNWWEAFMGMDSNAAKYSILYGTMFVLWIAWSWIFFIYWRQGDRYTQLGKMIRGLIAGSILEVMIAVPVHVWAARQRDCYCCRGSYTTLILAGTVLIWAFGPGIILLYLREKYRRAKLIAPEEPTPQAENLTEPNPPHEDHSASPESSQ